MPTDAACNKNAETLLDDSFELAKQLPDEDPGGSDHVRYYNTLRKGYARLIGDLVVAYGQAKCWSAALQAMEAIERPNLKLEAQAHLLLELVRQGELQAAVAFRDSLSFPDDSSGREAKEMTAFSLGKGFVLSGEIETGKQYFLSINTRWNHLESPTNLFVRALLEADRFEDATRYLSGYRHRDVHWRNANIQIIRHLIADGRKAAARERIRSALSGELASSYSPHSLAMLYARLDDPSKAIDYATTVKRESERARTLASVAQITPREAGVRQVLDAAVDAMTSCVGNDCDVTWTLIAREYADAGFGARAVELISEHIRKEHRRVHSLSVVAVSLARRGDIAGALEIKPSLAGYNGDRAAQALAIAYGKARAFESALAAFEATKNPHVKFTIAAALATQSLPSESIPAWLRHADDLSESNRASIYQVMMSALARRRESNTARRHISGNESSLTRARSLLGLAQGELGIVTGMDWLTTLRIL